MISRADEHEADLNAEESRPTRTEQTRAAAEVNKLGQQLVLLRPADLDRLLLPERVREEVETCQRLKPRARGRQNRLIGQLLRAEDHEAIRARLDSLKEHHRAGVQQEKQTEAWLDRLVEEGNAGVEALIASYPDAEIDRQRLRLLVRNAANDSSPKASKRARRELLRSIRSLRVMATAT